MTFCQSGLRNTVAASALRRAGVDVTELKGSYAGWARWSAEQAEAAPSMPLPEECRDPRTREGRRRPRDLIVKARDGAAGPL